jgi:hypothetical protein
MMCPRRCVKLVKSWYGSCAVEPGAALGFVTFTVSQSIWPTYSVRLASPLTYGAL